MTVKVVGDFSQEVQREEKKRSNPVFTNEKRRVISARLETTRLEFFHEVLRWR